MPRILTWRADENEERPTLQDLIPADEDEGNDATIIGRPRHEETPICGYCGQDARLPKTLYRFTERRPGGVIASGWRCA